MTFGVGSGIAAVLCGRVVKLIPQYAIVYTVYLINVGLVVFMLLWDTEPSYVAVFVTFFAWGICDGLWNSIPPSKISLIYSVYDSVCT